MVFVFLLRSVFHDHANNSWDSYNYEDYRFGVRSFKRWLKFDEQVIKSSEEYKKMEEDADDSIYLTPARKKRRLEARSFAPTPESASEPALTQLVVDTESSDDDE